MIYSRFGIEVTVTGGDLDPMRNHVDYIIHYRRDDGWARDLQMKGFVRDLKADGGINEIREAINMTINSAGEETA